MRVMGETSRPTGKTGVDCLTLGVDGHAVEGNLTSSVEFSSLRRAALSS